MKLSDYAKQMGVRYETAWRWFRDEKIQGRRIGPHTIIITESQEEPVPAPSRRVAIYARVSSAENKGNLDSQAERLAAYCTARGYQVAKVVKEVGSGVNDARPKLLALLEEQSIGLIVVEHKDRLTRFGFRYLDTLLKGQSRAIEVVNQAENGTEDLLADLTAIVYSFCARLYGQRHALHRPEPALEAGSEYGPTQQSELRLCAPCPLHRDAHLQGRVSGHPGHHHRGELHQQGQLPRCGPLARLRLSRDPYLQRQTGEAWAVSSGGRDAHPCRCEWRIQHHAQSSS